LRAAQGRGSARPTVRKSTAHGAGELRHGFGQAAEVRRVRRLPVERLVWPTAVVPVEALDKAFLLPAAVGRRAQIDPFVLDRPPQPLHEDVVVTLPMAVHADPDGVGLQDVGSPDNAAIATCALNCAPCCLRFTPSFHSLSVLAGSAVRKPGPPHARQAILMAAKQAPGVPPCLRGVRRVISFSKRCGAVGNKWICPVL